MGVTFIAPQGVYTSPAKLIEKTITENGTFTATDDEANGYSSVAVNVPLPTGKITITENGTNIDVAQYAKADVNVAGGGGSSDLSTAEVTVVYPAGVTNATVNGAFCFSRDGMDASIAIVTTSGVYDMILYKGGSIVQFTLGTGRSVTVTGNAEDLGGDAYLITGDCTITIS